MFWVLDSTLDLKTALRLFSVHKLGITKSRNSALYLCQKGEGSKKHFTRLCAKIDVMSFSEACGTRSGL